MKFALVIKNRPTQLLAEGTIRVTGADNSLRLGIWESSHRISGRTYPLGVADSYPNAQVTNRSVVS